SQKARAELWKRLLSAVVCVKPIRVECIDAGNLHVVDVLRSGFDDALNAGGKAFAIQRTTVFGEQSLEAHLLVAVTEPNRGCELFESCRADDELMVGQRWIGAHASLAIGQYSAARRAPIAVNARNNPEPQQHALHALQPSDVGLSEAHTDALFLVPLNATVSVEESAQKPTAKIAGGALHRRRD